MSADGRYVAFYSLAKNLDLSVNDNNSSDDAFLHDRVSGTTSLISVALDGGSSASGNSEVTWMSDDSGTLLLSSTASNLVSPSVIAASKSSTSTRSRPASRVATQDESGDPLEAVCLLGILDPSERYLLFNPDEGPEFDPNENGQLSSEIW